MNKEKLVDILKKTAVGAGVLAGLLVVDAAMRENYRRQNGPSVSIHHKEYDKIRQDFANKEVPAQYLSYWREPINQIDDEINTMEQWRIEVDSKKKQGDYVGAINSLESLVKLEKLTKEYLRLTDNKLREKEPNAPKWDEEYKCFDGLIEAHSAYLKNLKETKVPIQ